MLGMQAQEIPVKGHRPGMKDAPAPFGPCATIHFACCFSHCLTLL